MNQQDNDARTEDGAPIAGDGRSARRTRLPYEAPRVRSGPAFEKVVLESGCVEDQAFCVPPC